MSVTMDHCQYHALDILPESLIGERIEDWVPERVDEDAVEGQDVQFLRDRRLSSLHGVVDDVRQPAGYKHPREEAGHDKSPISAFSPLVNTTMSGTPGRNTGEQPARGVFEGDETERRVNQCYQQHGYHHCQYGEDGYHFLSTWIIVEGRHASSIIRIELRFRTEDYTSNYGQQNSDYPKGPGDGSGGDGSGNIEGGHYQNKPVKSDAQHYENVGKARDEAQLSTYETPYFPQNPLSSSKGDEVWEYCENGVHNVCSRQIFDENQGYFVKSYRIVSNGGVEHSCIAEQSEECHEEAEDPERDYLRGGKVQLQTGNITISTNTITISGCRLHPDQLS